MTKSLVPSPLVLAEAAKRRREQELKAADGPDNPQHEPAEAEKKQEADSKA